MGRSIGVILLCIFLVIFGATFFGLVFNYLPLILGSLAIGAAIFLALGK